MTSLISVFSSDEALVFVYRIYEIDSAGRVANRRDLSADTDPTEAIATAKRLAVDCVVELWRGNLLATFRPKEAPLPGQ